MQRQDEARQRERKEEKKKNTQLALNKQQVDTWCVASAETTV